MERFLSDQNFNGRILRGLIRRVPTLDLVRASEVDLAKAIDPVVLEWAASESQILLTHDINTIPAFAGGRIKSGLPMPGVFVVASEMPIGLAIDELETAIFFLTAEQCANFVTYFPL